MHDPQSMDLRRAASVKGGRARSNHERAKRQLIGADLSSDDLRGILATCIANVMVGAIEPGVANAVAGLVRTYLAVEEVTELETRLADLERHAALDAGGRPQRRA
jgi:hypothetical protein